jgi:hypothetical protein
MANYLRQRSTARFRHDGACGTREECWRPECRAEFPGYATVEVMPDSEVIARCHGGRFYPRAFRLEAAA